ncbi:MAG: hypothetical protein ABNH26_08805 [Celeribacter sp.]|jgi:hypothetical protein
MTTYTPITDGAIDQDSPITVGLMTALRDNPIAIAEGAPGAPLINGAIAAAGAAGAVGTYSLLRRTSSKGEGSGETLGDEVSGSGLAYSGINGPYDGTSGTYSVAYMTEGFAAPAGRWRCMGDARTPNVSGATVGSNYSATNWLRID